MNYIKIKLSKRDVESIENALSLHLATHFTNLGKASASKTLEMFRKRVKNGIKEKKPYKRTETYKK